MTVTPRVTLLACVASALLVYALGSCQGRDSSESQVHLDNAYRLARTVRPLREAVKHAESRVDTVRTAVGRVGEGVEVKAQLLDAQLDSARATLADSTATLAELRLTVTRLVTTSEAFRIQVRIYQDSVNVLMRRQLEERYAHQSLAVAQDSTIRAYQAATKALDCRVLGIRCPSRTESAGLGALAIVILTIFL